MLKVMFFGQFKMSGFYQRAKSARCLWLAVILLLSLTFHAPLFAVGMTAGERLRDVGVNAELGAQIPLDIPFTLHDGRTIELSELVLPDRPLIIVPSYFGCPMLCGLLTSGVSDMIENLRLQSGVDYNVVTVSFDPTEGADLSMKAKQSFDTELGEKALGWNFVTGEEENIQKLMDALGFGYKFVDGEYAHAAVIYILTAEGILSQYFLGVDFYDRLWDIRLSLVSAAEGRIGSLIDQAALFCFSFDPTKGKYSLVVFNVVRGVAFVGLLALVIFLSVLWAREWVKSKQSAGS